MVPKRKETKKNVQVEKKTDPSPVQTRNSSRKFKKSSSPKPAAASQKLGRSLRSITVQKNKVQQKEKAKALDSIKATQKNKPLEKQKNEDSPVKATPIVKAASKKKGKDKIMIGKENNSLLNVNGEDNKKKKTTGKAKRTVSFDDEEDSVSITKSSNKSKKNSNKKQTPLKFDDDDEEEETNEEVEQIVALSSDEEESNGEEINVDDLIDNEADVDKTLGGDTDDEELEDDEEDDFYDDSFIDDSPILDEDDEVEEEENDDEEEESISLQPKQSTPKAKLIEVKKKKTDKILTPKIQSDVNKEKTKVVEKKKKDKMLTPKIQPEVNEKKRKRQEQIGSPVLKKSKQVESDENVKTLFIRNIPCQTTEEAIKKLSSDILSVKFPNNLSKKNIKFWYCFVEFADETTAEKNLELLKNKKIGEHTLSVDFTGVKSEFFKNKIQEGNKYLNFKQIFVSGLIRNITKDQLTVYFPGHTKVQQKKLTKNKYSCEISFATTEKAKDIMEKQGSIIINGKKLHFSYAKLAAKKMKKPKVIRERDFEDSDLE